MISDANTIDGSMISAGNAIEGSDTNLGLLRLQVEIPAVLSKPFSPWPSLPFLEDDEGRACHEREPAR